MARARDSVSCMSDTAPQEQSEFAEPGTTDTPPEPVVAAAPADPTEALREQVAEAQRRESEANQRLDKERARFDQFLERSPQPAQAAPYLDPNGAPDPAIDIEGFNRHQSALHAQNKRELDEKLEAARVDTDTRMTVDGLWNQFAQKYPESSHQREIAGIAFQRLTASGLPSDTSGLIDNVKAEMDRMIGPAPTASSQPNRTAVAGGSAPPMPPAPTPAEPKMSTLSDGIYEFQEKAGYI